MYIASIPNRSSPPAILLRESYRKDGKVRTRTIANLTQWKSSHVAALRLILKNEFDEAIAMGTPTCGKSFGLLFALNHLAKEIGLSTALGKQKYSKLTLFLIFARIAHQGSRLSAIRWGRQHTVSDILGIEDFNENDLYKTLDWVADHQENIENLLYQHYLKGHSKPPQLVLYDVTSSYFEGDENELSEYGYNRDGKRGKKQIVIGLLTDVDGEPLAVRVFKGNTSDPTTIPEQVNLVKNQFGIEDVIFVGDRGMIKSKGKDIITEASFKYITALTNEQVRKLLKDSVIQPDLFDDTIHEIEHNDKRLILRCNQSLKRLEMHRREDKVSKLKAMIEERNKVVSDSKRARPSVGLKNVTEWVESHKMHKWVSVSLNESVLAYTIDEEAMKESALLDGCYVMESNVSSDRLDKIAINETYCRLQVVERGFRSMKTADLEIRPIFLRNGERTKGHIFISMLALKLMRAFESKLKLVFDTIENNKEAVTIDDAMAALSRLCFLHYGDQDQDTEVVRLPSPDTLQSTVLSALGLNLPTMK
jgi:transposase